MRFTFSSAGRILYGIPYVAKIKIQGDKLIKEYIQSNPDISQEGDVCVLLKYEAENYEIIEERYGSCSPDTLASYSLVYRKRLITLGPVGDLKLEEKIKGYLKEEVSICELITGIDELIKEQYEEEINEIFKLNEKKDNRDKKVIEISNALEEFIKINELIQVMFNDYHIIFKSEVEKILMNFCNEENIYIETQSMKLNISLMKINNYEIFNEKDKFNKIILDMVDGATITLLAR